MSCPVVIALRDGDRPIGLCGLHKPCRVARAAELGITIGERDCWGQGLGREVVSLLLDHAFLEANFNRVWLRVLDTNPRAIACYEKVGFVREGRLRDHFFTGGRYVDVHVLGVLQREWLARTR